MPQHLAKPTKCHSFFGKSWLMPVMLLLGLWLPISAQTPGSASGVIAGKVVTPAGMALAEAEVTAAEVATGLHRRIKVNDRGDFVLTDLPPGSYTILG